jgi:hypothetical protein
MKMFILWIYTNYGLVYYKYACLIRCLFFMLVFFYVDNFIMINLSEWVILLLTYILVLLSMVDKIILVILDHHLPFVNKLGFVGCVVLGRRL